MINNGPLGIDHPLVAVRDLQSVARQYEALGFAPTATTYHPWGTANRLVMLDGNFLELIGVADRALIAADEHGGRHFGRYIDRFLRDAEGGSLVALHSRNIDSDVAAVAGRGLSPSARIDFRRRVRLPDGADGEAVVSLATYIDEQRITASHFICQQHRPEMVFRAEWARHRNTARRIAFCMYMTEDLPSLTQRFAALYGHDSVSREAAGDLVTVPTHGGDFIAATPAVVRQRLAPVEPPALSGLQTRIVAIGIEVSDFTAAAACLNHADIVKDTQQRTLTVPAHLAGNVVLQMFESGRASNDA